MTNRTKNGILTLGDFLEMVKDMPATTQMVFANDDYYENIDEVVLPNEEKGYLAITFYTADTFDPRQF